MLNKQVSDEWMGQFEVSDNFSIKKKKSMPVPSSALHSGCLLNIDLCLDVATKK